MATYPAIDAPTRQSGLANDVVVQTDGGLDRQIFAGRIDQHDRADLASVTARRQDDDLAQQFLEIGARADRLAGLVQGVQFADTPLQNQVGEVQLLDQPKARQFGVRVAPARDGPPARDRLNSTGLSR